MERLYIENADGTEREVTDENEHAALMAQVVAGTVVSFVSSAPLPDGGRLIPNAANAAAHAQTQAAGQARDAAREARTVIVTIDDGVMLKAEERVELQGPPNAADMATVKTRMVAQRGVANPSHVAVETLAEFKARQP